MVPEDFRVEEQLAYTPEGAGDHLHLWIEKRLRNTHEVARIVAERAGVPPAAVGWAGRKDRVACTRQWFSVPGLDLARLARIDWPEGVVVLDAVPHGRKLRTGVLRGNRFRIVLRGVTRAQRLAAAARLAEIVRRGMPNAFGAQRFGRRGDNAERGRAVLAAGRVRGDRRAARFWVSALQSAVFNAVLARRARVDRLLDGDVAVVHRTGGLFQGIDAAVEQSRARRFEISPTGPIFGTKTLRATGPAGAIEAAVLADFDLPPMTHFTPPRGLRLYGARRSLRVRPTEIGWTTVGDDGLRLDFALPAGSYATVLLETLFPEGVDDVSLRTTEADRGSIEDVEDVEEGDLADRG